MGRRFPTTVLGLFVCAIAATTDAGTTRYVQAGSNLQAALNEAQPGDIILLEPGATFTGNFVLPVKDGSEFITLRSATPDSQLPPEGVRIAPQHAPLLTRIGSATSLPALRTEPGAHHWRLQFLELPANLKGYGEILAIGDGSSAQSDASQVPYAIVIDRVYIHGDPLLGQKRGIALNGRDVTIRGSHISDIKSLGQDSQAIGGWNGPGPYLIENNYLEAAGENILLGGSDPAIAGLVAENVLVRRNLVSKPLSWRSPIVDAPVTVAAEGAAGGGSLPPGVYGYRVVARRPAGQTSIARSTASLEATATIPADAVLGSVTVTWEPVPDATEYYIYGRTAGAQAMYWRVNTNSFVDTGAAGAAGSTPTSLGTRWIVKNLFELKNARDVLVEGNTFENNWEAAQAGYAIVFTPRNQDGRCTWCVVEGVRFEYNIVRHVAAAVNILGYDNEKPSQQARDITIRHNLFYDVTKSAWGGNGFFLMLGDEPRDIVVDHNTIAHTGTTLVYAYGGSATSPRRIYGFRFTNNVAKHNAYGIWSTHFTYGLPALAAYYPDAVVEGNLLAGGKSTRYPAGNYFYADFAGQFVNAAGDDYQLAPASLLMGAASDGTDVGADIFALTATAVDRTTLWDDFNDNALDAGKWSASAGFSGSVDPSIPVRETNSRLEIGPLKKSYGYNAARTAARDLTSASVSLQVAQVPDQAGTTNTMLTIGPDSSNHYRIFLSQGVLSMERKIRSVKTVLASYAYDTAHHQFWRIRHDAANGDVVFETAPANGSSPCVWTVLHREAWNTSAVPPASLMIELKAGASGAQLVTPGTVAFDNFRVVTK